MTRTKFALRAGAAAVGVLAFAAIALPAVAAYGDITGTKSNDASGLLHDGDVVSYTLSLSNTSANPQTNVLVQDDADPGLAYVPQSTFVTVTSYRKTSYVFDGGAGFTSTLNAVAWDDLPDNAPGPDTGTNYSSGSGWIGNWTEVNDGANDADTGLVRRTASNDNNALGFTGDGATEGGLAGPGIYRQFNAANTVDLRLDFQTGGNNLDDGDDLAVWYSGDGVSWTPAATIGDDNNEDVLRQVDISALAGDSTAYIRFGVAPGVTLAANEVWSVDSVIVLGIFEDVVEKDNVPGGTYADLANGVVPQIVVSGDAVSLPAPVTPLNGAGDPWVSGLDAEYQMEVDATAIPHWETELVNIGRWYADGNVTWDTTYSSVFFEYEPEIVMTVTSNGPVQTGQPIVITLTFTHGPGSDGSPVCVDDLDVPAGVTGYSESGDTNSDSCIDDGETWTVVLTYPAQATAGKFPFTAQFTGWSVNSEVDDDDVDVTVDGDLEVTVVLADTGASNAGLAGVAAALIALGAAALVVVRRRNA